MSKIFFSYSRKDSEFVDQLIEKLEARGVDIWVDRGDILAGVATWRQQIVEAIMECQVFVIVLSPNSIASDNVTKELTLAEQHVKHVLPLVIQKVTIPPSLDYQLAGLHYQTFAEGSYEDNFERLARSLGALGVTLTPKVEPISEETLPPIKTEIEPPTIEEPDSSIGVVPEMDTVIEDQKTETETLQPPETNPPEEPDPTVAVVAGVGVLIGDQKTETDIPPPVETILPITTDTVIETPTQQTVPDPTPSHPIQSQSLKKENPFQKIPIWLWAGAGLIALVGIVIVFVNGFGGNNQVTNPTATDEIAFVKLTATTEPTATDEIVQVLITETNAPHPTDVPIITPFPPRFTDDFGVPMVLIPAGSFRMGTDSADALKECQKVKPSLNCEAFFFGDEEPERTVSIDYDYYLDQFEVTNQQYDVCVTSGACAPPWNFDIVHGSQYFRNATFNDYPVVNVTWDAANDYCEWRGGKLPTEAEWEKAARGTEDARLYPWGITLDGTKANFCDANCSNSWANHVFNDGYENTAPVGSFPSGISLFGVEDMAGNVSEWVADLYGPYPGGEADVHSENFGKERVRRGGSWYSLGSDTRVSRRDKNLPSPQLEDPNSELGKIGFRCVIELP